MQITEEWLRDKDACEPGIDWWLAHGKSTVSETFKVISDVPQNGLWLIENSLDRVQSIKLAIFSAELVGGDCKIAKAVLANDCEETRGAASWSASTWSTAAAGAASWAAGAASGAITWSAAAAKSNGAAGAVRSAAGAANAIYATSTSAARHATYKQIFNYASELTK